MITFWRILKFGILNFWRNPWLSLATTLTLSTTLLIISIIFSLILVTQTVTRAVEEKMDMTIYLKDEASEEQITELRQKLKTFPEVKDVVYLSKQDALQIWQRLPFSPRTKEQVTPENNPLPRSLQVKVSNPEVVEAISNYLLHSQWSPFIRNEGISYEQNKTTIQRIDKITKFVKKSGLLLAGIFIAISVLVIFNTIRLAVINRKEEIEIQRLVGATNLFIEGPFLVEGILYGFLATMISTLFLYFLLRYISPAILHYLEATSFDLRHFFLANITKVFLAQFFIGVLIGGICSLLSVKRYLKI
jgi:cell division transport system permease protein